MAFLVHAGLNFWHFLIDLIHKSITYFKTLKTKTAAEETKLRFFCLFFIIVLVVVLVWIWEFIVSHLPEKEVQQRIKGLLLRYFGREWDRKNGNYKWAFLQSLLHCIKLSMLLAHFFLGLDDLVDSSNFLKQIQALISFRNQHRKSGLYHH